MCVCIRAAEAAFQKEYAEAQAALLVASQEEAEAVEAIVIAAKEEAEAVEAEEAALREQRESEEAKKKLKNMEAEASTALAKAKRESADVALIETELQKAEQAANLSGVGDEKKCDSLSSVRICVASLKLFWSEFCVPTMSGVECFMLQGRRDARAY
eukprot:SAG31_NODE_1750_length_7353_cov_17.309209_8_plen_157_part_00